GRRSAAAWKASWWTGAVFLLAFAIPPLAWFGYVLISRGPTGLIFSLQSTLQMAIEVTRSMALPLPRFNRSNLLSPESTMVLAYVTVPVTYLICGVAGLVASLKRHPT